ncbi:MAG: DUF4124 domain-containing protein [Betaproteobacteria bacterium]|nr:DUF4124 domain-containing protein [Betaproteobacteria bacterium]
MDTRFSGFLLALACGLFAASLHAQIYRWTDQNGNVHYSNLTPPKSVTATVVDPDAKEVPPAVQSSECYTVRCQGERMEERQRRRDDAEARAAAERIASSPKQARGLEFRRYISVQRGMTEGELLGIAGEPDLKADHGVAIAAPTTVQIGRHLSTAARTGLVMKTYTYLPTPADPFTTTVTLVGGRVSEIERTRKF